MYFLKSRPVYAEKITDETIRPIGPGAQIEPALPTMAPVLAPAAADDAYAAAIAEHFMDMEQV